MTPRTRELLRIPVVLLVRCPLLLIPYLLIRMGEWAKPLYDLIDRRVPALRLNNLRNRTP